MKGVIQSGATVLFVSHDMRIVSEFCTRALLLDRGRPITVGPTADVIAHYMNGLHQHRSTERSRSLVISGVTVRDENGPSHRFESGRKAWIDIEVSANKHVGKIAIGLYLLDRSHYNLLYTTTARLGCESIALESGDVCKCTFELDLNLGPGVYYPSVLLCHYDIVYDTWEPAATICVWSERDVTGVTNCFPKVVRHEVEQHRPLP
jgi:lipopolysaccharide transport system ATP-binding protein